jgi:RHS repeat-associated protein
MSDIGFNDQVPSLPDGGGSATGIGATFTPDLSTGTGGLSIPLDTPNGPNDIGPKLSLQYSTANGNGPFGFGFSLAFPRLVIDTEYGFPNYDGSDTILLEGAGPLLALGGGVYRPQVDGGAWRIQQSGAGFQMMTREAAVYTVGVDAAARMADPANSANVFAWYLESIVDALGYKATFTWRSDGGQLYLDTIAYGAYAIAFTYEARSDTFRSAQSGFTITTGLRCTQVELQLVGDAQPAVRRWTLAYSADPLNGASLLTSVTLSGLDKTGAVTSAPPLTLGYSTVGAPSLIRLGTSGDAGLPALTLGSTRRADLVDWNGDGLPDGLQVAAGGQAYVWLNTGDSMFQGPTSAGFAPGFARADAAIAFADMDGDGFADLIRYDLPLAGYVPRTAPGGFGEPVSWTQAPAPPVASPGVRVVDLDGDGIPDLLTSSEFGLTLYYRAGSQGWAVTPRVVPQGVAPEVDLADPHVFLADMTGDGAYDIVRVTGGGVTYWPYLGNGRWDAPVIMANSPSLPFDVNVDRLFLTDIDGDGCSDLIYLAPDRVIYWINRAGLSFGPPLTIDYVPGNAIVEPRLADMTGSGTAGLVWTSNGPFGASTQYFYLQFVGSTAPRLLTSIDNGVGLVTTVEYTTSAQEAARAARAGNPWSTTMPIALPIVKSMSVADTATGNVRTSQFTYRNGRYDGVLREFAGFGQVDQTDVGDTVAPTLLTSSWFHLGVDPAQPAAPLDLGTRQMLRAIRGRLYKRKRYAQDGSPAAANPYDRTEYSWTVATQTTVGGSVFLPRLSSTVQTVFEREVTAVSVITTINNTWDTNGNVTDAVETAVSGGSTVQTLHTTTAYATDPAGHFISKAYRVQQFDGTGTIVADQVLVYDNAAEGQTGTQGLVTRRSSLAITDAAVTAVYGAATPDFASYHYFRRTDSQGWWVNQGQYERTVDATGLHGTAEGPNGGVFTVAYDANQTFPVAITDPMGNKVSATYDYRVSRVATLTDASGEIFSAGFDSLARILARVEPGDSAALPTITYTYDTAQIPVSRTESMRATSGLSETVDTQTIHGGDGSMIEQREFDETGEIAVRSLVLNARGLLAQDYLAWRPASSTYSLPATALRHAVFTYDALGRPLTRTDADGNVTSWTFGPGTVEQTDAAGKTTRTVTDATGRIVAIEEHLGSATLTSTYTFDVKGNLIQHTDAAGQVVKTWYDALGRVLRVQRPEHDSSTVFDAGGNPVESRTPAGVTLARTYDLCNRPVTVSVPGAATPAVRYTYDDAGSPPPPDAGTHTAGGRCVRIDDQSGSSTFDYDARGRTVVKRSTPAGNPQRVLTLAYRADGQLANVTYPRGAVESLSVGYQYGKRGLVSSIPGVVSAVSYDLQGRRASVGYANGVTSTYAYDNAERLIELNHANTSGALRQTQFSRDRVGNLTGIVSPDNTLAATFSYDDLHRLVQAATGAGDVRTYAYDNAGNLTSKSDVGSYAYGENGMPATCLTTAGSAKFTYTAFGQMEHTPWGTQSFDAFGRLVAITGAIAGSNSATFAYDYSGSRVAAQFVSGGVTTTRLTPDALYAIENGTLVNYLFDGLRFIARDVDGGARTYLHEDHVGSLVLITDASGTVADSIRYDAFGAIVARLVAGSNVPVGFAQGTFDDASGLLYLQSRYYHPQFGRFVSPDSMVPDVFLPIAWNAYAYCANNPQTYADPTGHAWWQILVGVLAVIALVALTVVTFGVAAPAAAAIGTATLVALYATVAVGVVAGGIIGGIAASKAGGSIGDIILGALVGAAVGGWAALGSFVAGGAISAALGPTSHLLADVVAGATAGAINGAATGFATGFAGGKGTLDQTLADIALGALIGFVVGGALGGAQYALSGSPPTAPTTNPGQTPPGPPADPTNAGGLQNPPAGATNSLPSAALKAASPWLSYAGQLAARPILMSPFIYTADVLLTDTATGVLDMGYGPQILQWLKQNNVSI